MELPIETAVAVALIVSELVSNAVQHARSGTERPELNVVFSRTPTGVELRVADNGPGLSPELDPRSADSMGFVIVRELARQLDGLITFGRGAGLEAMLEFPLY